jgi:hypothetical protein
MKRRGHPLPAPSPPSVPELVSAPELAAIVLLEHALDLTAHALLAQHPTLTDDCAQTPDDGPVVTLAHSICRRAAALEQVLRRYRHAVRDAVTPPHNDDLPF